MVNSMVNSANVWISFGLIPLKYMLQIQFPLVNFIFTFSFIHSFYFQHKSYFFQFARLDLSISFSFYSRTLPMTHCLALSVNGSHTHNASSNVSSLTPYDSFLHFHPTFSNPSLIRTHPLSQHNTFSKLAEISIFNQISCENSSYKKPYNF